MKYSHWYWFYIQVCAMICIFMYTHHPMSCCQKWNIFINKYYRLVNNEHCVNDIFVNVHICIYDHNKSILRSNNLCIYTYLVTQKLFNIFTGYENGFNFFNNMHSICCYNNPGNYMDIVSSIRSSTKTQKYSSIWQISF